MGNSARSGKQSRRQIGKRARTLEEQVRDLARYRGILKKDIAERMGIAPSRLSQILKGPASIKHVERIALAAGVSPDYFDAYVAKAAERALMLDRSLLELVRNWAFP